MDTEEEKLNFFQKNVKDNNPNKEYPSNLGKKWKKWTEHEESLLLTELDNNLDIEIIAENHNRTKGGIISRQKEIAYKMSINNISMTEIIEKTKLDEITVNEYIKKKNKSENTIKKKPIKKNIIKNENFSIEDEINEMKNDIKELKNTLNELVDMIKVIKYRDNTIFQLKERIEKMEEKHEFSRVTKYNINNDTLINNTLIYDKEQSEISKNYTGEIKNINNQSDNDEIKKNDYLENNFNITNNYEIKKLKGKEYYFIENKLFSILDDLSRGDLVGFFIPEKKKFKFYKS